MLLAEKMNVSEMYAFEVAGFLIRTTNADELNPSRAKIGNLWANFYANAAPKLNSRSRIPLPRR